MTDGRKKALLLAAVICLAPGGFILGATLAANHLRKRRRAKGAAVPPDETQNDEMQEDATQEDATQKDGAPLPGA